MSECYPAVRSVGRLAAAVALAACAIAAAAITAPSAQADVNDSATLLVASPGNHHPLWSRTVVLAAPIEGGAHVGVIVNRPTTTTLATLFPEHEPSRQVGHPVSYGGPFFANAIIAVLRKPDTPAGTSMETIAETSEVLFAADRDTVDRIIASSADRARYYVGLVVWQPGELDAEMEKGVWSVARVDPSIAFRDDTRSLWQELSGLKQARAAPRRAAVR